MSDRETRIAARARSLQNTFGMAPDEAREVALVGMGLHAEAALIPGSMRMTPQTIKALRRRSEERESRLAGTADPES